MRKIISILLLATMMLHALPLVQLCTSNKEMVYSADDDGGTEKSKEIKEKKEGKEFLYCSLSITTGYQHKVYNAVHLSTLVPHPFLDYSTPPPDVA